MYCILEYCSVYVLYTGVLFSICTVYWSIVQYMYCILEYCSVYVLYTGVLFSICTVYWSIVQYMYCILEYCSVYVLYTGPGVKLTSHSDSKSRSLVVRKYHFKFLGKSHLLGI